MKRDFLKELGLEKDAIDKIMAANGEDIENARKAEQTAIEAEKEKLSGEISQLQAQVNKRDGDIKKLQNKLSEAGEDNAKLADAQKAIEDMKAQYEADRKDWEAQTAKQAYEFAVKTETGKLKFSSNAARNDFTRGVIEAGLKMDGDTLLGFSDYVDKYRESDPDAFAAEKTESAKQQSTPASIVAPTGSTEPSGNPFDFHFQKV